MEFYGRDDDKEVQWLEEGLPVHSEDIAYG